MEKTAFKKHMKIVITGPESSGKSTLFKSLENHYKIKGVREFSRDFLSSKKGQYKYADLLTIAKGQLNSELELINSTDFLLCDTDLLTIKIWSYYKFISCDPEIINLLNSNPADLYVLMSPDIPWESDPLRENPADRNELLAIYEHELTDLGVPYFLISGSADIRLNKTIKLIDNHL